MKDYKAFWLTLVAAVVPILGYYSALVLSQYWLNILLAIAIFVTVVIAWGMIKKIGFGRFLCWALLLAVLTVILVPLAHVFFASKILQTIAIVFAGVWGLEILVMAIIFGFLVFFGFYLKTLLKQFV
ncbi:MAG: hypothetical protein A2Y67_00375 [Candidatus Buchananbacteria bacterium RBG_13_39_9]|uniref:Uncharacterized protein n=1 Tax=Candidatus Buchananbacteria bacterium RBG_13_39_9 TaxID=1797531 RepID=A0A1G1XQZ6_9BACT|nr:MAG: hypothetical protein A2Y67_00375 [Candidatus Buchananbacteria bacterium RBG_13_39_9]